MTGKEIAAFAPPGTSMSGKEAELPERVAWATTATFVFDPKVEPLPSDRFSQPESSNTKHGLPLRSPTKFLPTSTSMRSIKNEASMIDYSDSSRFTSKNNNEPMPSSIALTLSASEPEPPSRSSTAEFTKDTQLMPPPSLALDKFPIQKSQASALRLSNLAVSCFEAITIVVLFVVAPTFD